MTKKQVGLNFFNNKIKELEKTEVFYFDEEKTEYINYSVNFSMSKIQKTIEELIQTIKYCKQKGDDSLTDGVEILKYLEFLTFKNFTDTEKLLKDKDFDYKLKMAKNLHDTGLIMMFMEDVFKSSEVKKVVDTFTKFIDNSEKMLEKIEEK